jgi:outer membrane protein insertion porin family
LQYVPLGRRFTLAFNAEVGYGDSLGDTTALPPFRQFFSGGPDSVRGYTESRLGPKDNFGRPYGGNMKVVGRTELILPMPQKWQTSARISAFYDIGNVFSTGGVNFFGRDGVTPVDYDFDYSKLKKSTGLAVQWLAPLGLFRFSFAFPLNADKDTPLLYGDETERFQFSIGQAF